MKKSPADEGIEAVRKDMKNAAALEVAIQEFANYVRECYRDGQAANTSCEHEFLAGCMEMYLDEMNDTCVPDEEE